MAHQKFCEREKNQSELYIMNHLMRVASTKTKFAFTSPPKTVHSAWNLRQGDTVALR